MNPQGFFNIIILLGSIQGFILSTLLFISKPKRLPNRILAALLLLFSLASLYLYGNYINWFGSALLNFITQIIPFILPMAFGPLIYFYVRSTLEPNFLFSRKDRIHFLPLIIDLVPSLLIIFYGIGVKAGILTNNPQPWGIFIDDYNVYADLPRWASVSFYVWLSSKYLSKLDSATLINGKLARHKWLKQFITVFAVFQFIWLIYLIPYIIPAYTDWMLRTFDWYPIYIPLAVIIYWLGLKGYMFAGQQKDQHNKPLAANAQLPEPLIAEVSASLKNAMERDKLFLNPSLNLATTAEKTGINQRIISTVLNQHLNKSFIEFVNEYRVAEFKEKARFHDNLTIAGIALECGFNSQATFQRVFRNSTGLTPSEFISSKLL